MSDNNDSYNQRQFDLMLEKIKFYRSNQCNLNKIILDLEALLSCLKGIDMEWKNNFIKEWAILEYVYSFMVYEGRNTLNSEEISSVDKALFEIDKLIKDITRNQKISVENNE